MSQKYTAEEVRNAARLLDGLSRRMLTDYDDRIKADESAVPAAWQYRYKNGHMQWSRWIEWVPEEHPEAPFPKMIGRWEVEYRKLFTHPPAQAAQADSANWFAGKYPTTTEPMAQPAGSGRDEDRMSDELRDFIEGMSVSVDVSTGDADAGNRYFGTVTEVMDDRGSKHGVILLVQDAEPNFALPSDAQGQGEAVACPHHVRYPHPCRECEDATPAGVPDGWVRVPREPTEAMQTAHHIYGDTSDWWSAVIAAVSSAHEGELA